MHICSGWSNLPGLAVLLSLVAYGKAHVAGQNSDEVCASRTLVSYNLKWHIAGVFVIFTVPFFGIFGTMLLGTRLQKPFIANALQLLKVFGIGVVAATAWIHLLPDAFSQFSSSCLTGVWASYGINWVGAFALISTFGLQLLENALRPDGKANTHGHAHFHMFPVAEIVSDEQQNPWLEDVHVDDDNFSDSGVERLVVSPSFKEGEYALPLKSSAEDVEFSRRNGQKLIMVMTLELGILIHSVVIGLSLGVSTGRTYTTLLIAICFHQLFEGMALGALIGATSAGLLKKVIMCLFYPLTTPMGMTIGIVVRESYNENSPGLILFMGITGSLSSGILMYNTYCNLLSEEINQSEEFLGFRKGWKFINYGVLYLGASSMAVIGNWA